MGRSRGWALVVQQCGQCRRAERMKGRLIGAQTTQSRRISCKGQVDTGEQIACFQMNQLTVLAITRYLFSPRPLYKIQCYYSQTPSLFGHPNHPLHRLHYCAIQCRPPAILYCNTCHTILVMAISCKGQHTVTCHSSAWRDWSVLNSSDSRNLRGNNISKLL